MILLEKIGIRGFEMEYGTQNFKRIQEENLKIIIDVYDNYSEDVFNALRLKNIIRDRDFLYDFQIDDVELTFNNIKTFSTAKKVLKKYIQ
jgi:hypothetical protein